jgi:hypothetical protein
VHALCPILYGLHPDFLRATSCFAGYALIWQWLCRQCGTAAPCAGLWLCKSPPLVWAHPRPSSSAGFRGVGAASAPALDLRPKLLAVLRPAFAHTCTTTGGPRTLWHEATAQDSVQLLRINAISAQRHSAQRHSAQRHSAPLHSERVLTGLDLSYNHSQDVSSAQIRIQILISIESPLNLRIKSAKASYPRIGCNTLSILSDFLNLS